MDVDLDFELSVDNAIKTAQRKGKALNNRELTDSTRLLIHSNTHTAIESIKRNRTGISQHHIIRPAILRGSQIFNNLYWGVVEETDTLIGSAYLDFDQDELGSSVSEHHHRSPMIDWFKNRDWQKNVGDGDSTNSLRLYSASRAVSSEASDKMMLENVNDLHRCFLNLGLSESNMLSKRKQKQAKERALDIIEYWEARRDILKMHVNGMKLLNASSVSREDLANMSLEQKSEDEIRQIMEEKLDEN